MASFTKNLRGYDFTRTQKGILGLERDLQRLDRTREQFDDPPPPCTSDRLDRAARSRSQSPDSPSEETIRRQEERLLQLAEEAAASKPRKQFSAQIREERKRISEASLNGTHRLSIGDSTFEIAYENVKKRWVEQGIWSNKWNNKLNNFASEQWEHEEPLEVESDSETDMDPEAPPTRFSLFSNQPLKARRPKSNKERRRIAEQRLILERERQASRPYYQFVYQTSMERERIQNESANDEDADAADINTRAYENVKNIWIKRKIWNKRWGVLPGMSWKHEKPLEEEIADGIYEVRRGPWMDNGAPLRTIDGRLYTDGTKAGIFIRNPTPVESDLEEDTADGTTPQVSPGSPLMVNGFLFRNLDGRVVPYHSQSGIFSRNPPPDETNHGEASGVINTSPRRNNQIQPPLPSIAKDLTRTGSTQLSKSSAQSKPERNAATRSSAKPQGISKKQRAKTTGRKVRKG